MERRPRDGSGAHKLRRVCSTQFADARTPLSRGLGALFDSGELSDVTVRVHGPGGAVVSEHRLHRAILAARAPQLFHAAFSGTFPERDGATVDLTTEGMGASAAAVSAYLRYLYTGVLPLTPQRVSHAAALADRFLDDVALAACAAYCWHMPAADARALLSGGSACVDALAVAAARVAAAGAVEDVFIACGSLPVPSLLALLSSDFLAADEDDVLEAVTSITFPLPRAASALFAAIAAPSFGAVAAAPEAPKRACDPRYPALGALFSAHAAAAGVPLARPLPAEACAALVGCVRLSGLSYPALLGARARFGDAAVLDELERRGAIPAPPTPRIGAARGLTVDVTVGADASFALGGLWWRLCTEVRGGAAPSLFLQLDRARCPFASVLAVGAAGLRLSFTLPCGERFAGVFDESAIIRASRGWGYYSLPALVGVAALRVRVDLPDELHMDADGSPPLLGRVV